MEHNDATSDIQPEKVLSSLGLSNSSVINALRELERSRNEQSQAIIRHAMQQYDAGEEQTALPDQEGNDMYEMHTRFDKKKFLSERSKGKVLDIGSGGINELEDVVPDNQVTYLDIKRYPQKNFVQADASRLPFADNTFDTIYTSGLMNSYRSARKLLPEILRAIKPDGTIIIRPHGQTDEIIENLAALSDLGIDLEKQCELTLVENTRKHKNLPLSLDKSEMFITVRV